MPCNAKVTGSIPVRAIFFPGTKIFSVLPTRALCTQGRMRKITGFVPQDDIVHEDLTVK